MTNSSEDGIKYPFAYNLINGLEMYYMPALVVLGSLGNCLSVYVVFATKMRRTSSSFYLAALAISDTGFLMSVFIAWLGLVNVQLVNQQGFCQFFVYLTNVCSFLSACPDGSPWQPKPSDVICSAHFIGNQKSNDLLNPSYVPTIFPSVYKTKSVNSASKISRFVVAFTVERFVAVCYPLRRQWMCTVNRAKLLISGVTIAGLVLSSPVLLYSRVVDSNNREVCSIAEGWDKVASAINFLDTILTFALPFSLIVVLNSLIVQAVWHVDTVRTSLKARASTRDSPPAVHQARVTKMLLVVSSVFFCLNLPAYAMRVYAYLQMEDVTTELEYLTQKACNLLFNTNFGISFGLYCASGQNFRAAVAQLFHCRRKRQLRIGQSKRSSTNQTNPHGTETIRISGSASGEHTIISDKPWRDSFQLKSYPRTTQQGEKEVQDCYTLRKEYDARL